MHLDKAMSGSDVEIASTHRAASSSADGVTTVWRPSVDSAASTESSAQAPVGKAVRASSKPASSGTLYN